MQLVFNAMAGLSFVAIVIAAWLALEWARHT
jgi:hypothetical protein